jgi:DNA adenine methylase
MNKLFAYPGGKWPIRNEIIALFPPHMTYVDVFGGSASILISKPPSVGEVYNDRNEELANFFRVVKHRPAELVEKAKFWIHSRALWIEKKGSIPLKDEVAKAFRFWVLLEDSFGGIGGTFGTSREVARSVTHARDYLEEVANRLRSAHIECLDFRECIKKYDATETFFYCDPPYLGTKGGDRNYDQMTKQDWQDFRDILGSIKGKFLLSSSSHKMVISLFKGYAIRRITVPVSLPARLKNSKRQEILIANYRLPRREERRTFGRPKRM